MSVGLTMSPLQLSVVCPLQFGPSEWYSGSGSSQAAPVGPTCLRQIRGPGLSKPVHSDRCRLEKNATQMAAISWRLTAHVRAAHVHRVRQPDVFVEAAVGGMEAWGRPQVPCQQHSQSAFATAVFDSIDKARTMQHGGCSRQRIGEASGATHTFRWRPFDIRRASAAPQSYARTAAIRRPNRLRSCARRPSARRAAR